MNEPILEVENLATGFVNDEGELLRAVDGVSFSVARGKVMGLVGESGCGKSVTAFSLTRLLPQPSGRVLSGSAKFGSVDLLKVSDEEMRKLRGSQVSMIFQEPMSALNPTRRIKKQLEEIYRLHLKLSEKELWERSLEMLRKVGIPAPEIRIGEFPHQLSGGMRQRVMIAIALALRPALLIADEPTTALDVTVQAQILDLMQSLQREMGMAVILITHDLGVIAETCDDVSVMYAGRIVERAPVRELFANPRHAYTQGLLSSIPRLEGTPKTRLPIIEGVVPSLKDMPVGCRFAPRSRRPHEPEHIQSRPPFKEVSPGHWVEACPVCAPL